MDTPRSINEVAGDVRREFVETRESMVEKIAAGETLHRMLAGLQRAGFATKHRGVSRVSVTPETRRALVKILRTLLRDRESKRHKHELPVSASELRDDELEFVVTRLLNGVEVLPVARFIRGRFRTLPDGSDEWIEPTDGGPDLFLCDIFPEEGVTRTLAVVGSWEDDL
jgi:hypothetical protein